MMWSRVLLVGSLALSERIPFSSSFAVVSTTNPSSSSAEYVEKTVSSSSSTSPLFASSESSSCRDDDSNNDGTLLASSPSFSFEKYHLLWSPHAWKKMLGTMLVMLILPRLPAPATITTKISGLALLSTGSLYQNLILPLAASSCCLLQLGLNLLSVGCAGWNSYLGPVRPYFLGILLISNFRHRPARMSTLLLRSSVALLPEMVFMYNAWQQANPKGQATSEMMDLKQQFVLELDIPTMGCVACINAIDGRLRRVPGVLQVSSALKPLGEKGGSAALVVATDDAASTTSRIIEAVADAGFDGATLTSMRPKERK